MECDCLDERARQRLQDILDANEELHQSLRGYDEGRFASERGIQRIAERLLEIAGEAATHVPEDVTEMIHADWSGLRAMRIILAHAYRRVDSQILWDSATRSLPAFARAVREVLEP